MAKAKRIMIEKQYQEVFELGIRVNTTVDKADEIRFESDDEYYGDKDYMSNSRFGNMEENVHEFYQYLLGNHKYPSKQVYVFGRLVHTMVYEPEKVSNFLVAPKTGSEHSRKNAGWQEFLRENPFDWSVTEYEMRLAQAIADSYLSTDGIRDMIERSEQEKAFVGVDPFGYGIPVKGKIDNLDRLDPDFLGSLVISDLKTSGKKVDDFRWSIKSFDYLRPAAMYMELTGADVFKFHPVHKGGGHAVGEYYLERDSQSFKKGMFMYEEAVEKYHRLFVQGRYSPTYLYSVRLP
jgi:hypothetical protein